MTTELAQDNLKLLQSGDFADVEIICQGRVWKVHSAILVGRSSWFKNALSKEWKEAQTRKIIIENVDPQLMDILVRYIYTNDLPPMKTHAGPHACLERHVQLYIQADYFLLSRLKDWALKRLKADFCSDAIRCFRYLVIGHYKAPYSAIDNSWGAGDVKIILEDFFRAVRLAYSVLTARDLHKAVTAFALCLRRRIDIAVLEELFKDIPEFRADFDTTLTALLFDAEFGNRLGSRALLDKAQSCVTADTDNCRECSAKLKDSYYVFVNPLPDRDDKWCKNCAQTGFTVLVEDLIHNMPIE